MSNWTCSCFWSICLKSLFFFCLSRDVQVTCTKEFHSHIMASRSNMAARSGCGVHADVSYKTEDKQQSNYLFIHLLPHTHTHTVELKASFETTWMHSFVTAPGPRRSLVSYTVKRTTTEEAGEETGEVENKNTAWMRFQSRHPGRERLAELSSFVRQFPLPQKSHVQHTRDKQHVWFRLKIKAKKKKKRKKR